MAVVDIYEGSILHRFPNVPEGYRAAVRNGEGVLEIDPNYRQEELPGMTREAQMGQGALMLATELEPVNN